MPIYIKEMNSNKKFSKTIINGIIDSSIPITPS
jgi:hypothetical protein